MLRCDSGVVSVSASHASADVCGDELVQRVVAFAAKHFTRKVRRMHAHHVARRTAHITPHHTLHNRRPLHTAARALKFAPRCTCLRVHLHAQCGADPTESKRAMLKLRTACESALRFLTTSPQMDLEVEALHEGCDLRLRVSRARFEDLCADLWPKIKNNVQT